MMGVGIHLENFFLCFEVVAPSCGCWFTLQLMNSYSISKAWSTHFYTITNASILAYPPSQFCDICERGLLKCSVLYFSFQIAINQWIVVHQQCD